MIKALTSVKNTKFLKKLRTLPNYANSLQGDYIAVQFKRPSASARPYQA
jgi:hypothetical protein